MLLMWADGLDPTGTDSLSQLITLISHGSKPAGWKLKASFLQQSDYRFILMTLGPELQTLTSQSVDLFSVAARLSRLKRRGSGTLVKSSHWGHVRLQLIQFKILPQLHFSKTNLNLLSRPRVMNVNQQTDSLTSSLVLLGAHRLSG